MALFEVERASDNQDFSDLVSDVRSGNRAMGRNTQGVRVINLKAGDAIADVARLILEDGDEASPPAGGDGVAAPPVEPEAA